MTARYALLYADIIEKFCIYFLHFWILGCRCCGIPTADPGDYFVRRARWAARRVYRTIRHSSMQGFRSPVRVDPVEVVEWKASTPVLSALGSISSGLAVSEGLLIASIYRLKASHLSKVCICEERNLNITVNSNFSRRWQARALSCSWRRRRGATRMK